MLSSGILNPELAALLTRFRHVNTIAVLDAPFPFYPNVPTIDLTLVRGIPTISQVLDAVLPTLEVGNLVVADEFAQKVDPETVAEYVSHHRGLDTVYVPHTRFKELVGECIGIIRTADIVPYSNVIITGIGWTL